MKPQAVDDRADLLQPLVQAGGIGAHSGSYWFSLLSPDNQILFRGDNVGELKKSDYREEVLEARNVVTRLKWNGREVMFALVTGPQPGAHSPPGARTALPSLDRGAPAPRAVLRMLQI